MRSIKRESLILPLLEKRIRLSDIPADTFVSIQSRKGFKKAIKNGLITIDGKIGFTSDYVKGGECIEIFQDAEMSKKPTIAISLEVLYEDNFLAIVYKPAGIVVSGNKKYTLENALPNVLKTSTKNDALLRPEPIHRLDYPTSGCVLIGKTSSIVIQLNKLFEERKITKTYHAVTIGELSQNGIIDIPVEGKESHTDYKILQKLNSTKYDGLNLVKLYPKTGRKHQIRKHLAYMDSPILGDNLYGIKGKKGIGSGLYLHATSLSFTHPVTKESVSIETKLPKKFTKLFAL